MCRSRTGTCGFYHTEFTFPHNVLASEVITVRWCVWDMNTSHENRPACLVCSAAVYGNVWQHYWKPNACVSRIQMPAGSLGKVYIEPQRKYWIGCKLSHAGKTDQTVRNTKLRTHYTYRCSMVHTVLTKSEPYETKFIILNVFQVALHIATHLKGRHWLKLEHGLNGKWTVFI